jgi:2-iminobutanoate/2-iminopropanoate deaminase
MEKTILATLTARAAIGPYEHGIRFGSFIFTSGQIPINPETNELISGEIEDETKQVLKNIGAVLEAGGSSLENTVKITVYLKNMSNFSRMNKIYQSFFSKNKPARTCVEVSELPKGVGVEMDAVAFVEKD